MVNVAPTDKPQDAYKVAAEAAKAYLPERLHHLLNRKVTKRTMMTIPYGVTYRSAWRYIREELPQEVPNEDVSLIAKAVFEQAIPAVIPGAIRAMEFLKGVVSQALQSSGSPSLSWTTPGGFTVRQFLPKQELSRIGITFLTRQARPPAKAKTTLLGSRRIQPVISTPLDSPDPRAHRAAIAPNFIHSLDAALLHLTFWDEKAPFYLVHDCLLMRSCDIERIQAKIRETFVSMYQEDVLQQWADQLGVTFNPDVMVGSLDIQTARQSRYLFC
jgi:DNA-directed RNA polymerase